jgi:hypothetical protein
VIAGFIFLSLKLRNLKIVFAALSVLFMAETKNQKAQDSFPVLFL